MRRARKWLQEHGVEFEARHLVKNNLTKDEFAELYEISQVSLNKFFNSNGKVYKEMGLKDKIKDMSDEEKLELLASDGMLVKRPILTDRKEVVIIGFKEKEYKEIVK
ncbi:Spx/MgsR family RNA polymerase-binding regulatory protein [Proteinivorax tanatarense]|uniref:Spx/MgsR family RNA polymerase-binding regulatory protein n=1 Tax=Proteinivorax tanatarense TaxID=1260629 RepID=A0AAU7VGZ9_9FIRM